MKVEICKPLKLNETEETQVAMHSFYNVLNVIITQLQLLREVLNNEECLNTSISLCWKALSSFSDPELAFVTAGKMDEYKAVILEDVKKALAENKAVPSFQHIVDDAAENLKKVFNICDVRVREFMSHINALHGWTTYSLEYLAGDLRQVLDVIAENSRGRYGIVYKRELQRSNDYLVEIDIRSPDNSTITMPAVFQDCFRDIVANARKYTPPGGRISASLVDNGQHIELIVSDTGRGIPLNEIEKVVEFGARGSNTTDDETKGGGFGLTKAYYTCRKFSGRMWIESGLGVGTTVTIRIPHQSGYKA